MYRKLSYSRGGGLNAPSFGCLNVLLDFHKSEMWKEKEKKKMMILKCRLAVSPLIHKTKKAVYGR